MTYASVASRWHSRTKLGKAQGNIYNCQEETLVAVLQDQAGEVFNTQPHNIA